MNLLWKYLSTSSHWSGSTGILQRLSEHVVLSFSALLAAAIIAIPVGIAVGHSGRGDDVPILFWGAGRVLAPLGVLVYFAMKVGTGSGPAFFMLALLGIPPMMSAGYTGVRLVDRAVVDSARACGMLPGQVLHEVEIPIAMPALVRGVRRAAVQVIMMAAVAAYVGAGGLGRMIIDGQSPQIHDYGMIAAGGVLLAALAVAVDLLIAWFGAGLVTPGAAGQIEQSLPAQRAESSVPMAMVGSSTHEPPSAGY